MVDDGGGAALVGILLLLTHVGVPVGTVIGGVVATRTAPGRLRWRGIIVAAAWIIAPWLATCVSLALAGFDPIDALLHLEFVNGVVPRLSLVAGLIVGAILAVRCRRTVGQE